MRTAKSLLRLSVTLLAIFILLIPTACGEKIPATGDADDQQGKSGSPGVIHFPEVTKKDWVEGISKLCLQVDQTYTGLTGLSEPIAEELKALLDRIGVETTIGENPDCQANLKIVLEMTPVGESVIGAGTCYFKANARGSAILTSSGKKDLTLELSRTVSTGGSGFSIVYSCPSQSEANYERAWAWALAPMVAEWWGAPGLVSALRSESYEFSDAATYKLKEAGASEEVIPVLIEMLGDVSPGVREAAAKTLGFYGPAAADAVPALIEIVDDPDFGVKHEVVLALGYIGDERAIPVLLGLLQGGDTSIQSLVYSALGAMKEKAAPAVPQLIEGVKSDDYTTASSALDALSAIGPAAKEAVPALIEILEQGENATLQDFVVSRALEGITGQEFGENAAAWRSWWEQNK